MHCLTCPLGANWHLLCSQVQRFSEFDASGKLLKEQWQTIIDDATKRLGGMGESRCRVTVTDKFGGRGHDFQVTGNVTRVTLAMFP